MTKKSLLIIVAMLIAMTAQSKAYDQNADGREQRESGKKPDNELRITDESTFFRRGTGIIRGRFEGKHPTILTYSGTNAITQTDAPKVFDVADDGTFEAAIEVENPILDYLHIKNKKAYFYISAGDTLNITIQDDGTVVYADATEHSRLLNILTNANPNLQLDYNDVQAEATADTAALARYVDWYEAKLDSLTEAAGQIAAHHGLSPRETHMLKTRMLIMNIRLFFEPSELWYKTKEAMNTDHYRLMRRIPHDDLTCLMFPDELSILLNKYQNCKPMLSRIFESIRRQTTDTDSVYVAADMAIMGTDRPSTFLQLLWLNDTEYYNRILHKPQEVLQMIEHRKSIMTSDYMKARIDGIRQKLTSPGAYARTLPEGKATDIFNAIMEKYRGKYVYVDFWATSCGPCRSNIERSQELRNSLSQRQDIELVFITNESNSPQREYDKYVDKHLKGEECYRISDDDYKRLMALFRFNGIPHHELVAPDGRIIDVKQMGMNIRIAFSMNFKQFMNQHNRIIAGTFMQGGTGIIRGRFEGKHPEIIGYAGVNAMTMTTNPLVFDVTDDGTFEATIQLECPTLDFISSDKGQVYFYLCPGDTLNLTIGKDRTVVYPDGTKCGRLLNMMSNDMPNIAIDYDEARKLADILSPKEYTQWTDSCINRLEEMTDSTATANGLTPLEARLLKMYMLLTCGDALHYIMLEKALGCTAKAQQQQTDLTECMKSIADPDMYGFMRRMPHNDITCLSLPSVTNRLLERYRSCGPIELKYTKEGTIAKGDDITALMADMKMCDNDMPSVLIQLTWLCEKEYRKLYATSPEAALERIDTRREFMVSPFLRQQLDKIRERLVAPRTAVRELPEGKATDIFNAIMKKYRGKYVYVDFWGTRCWPCRLDIEKSQALRDSLSARQDIELVFISGKADSPQKEYDEYVDKHLKGEECYRISADDYKRLMALFGFNGIPHHELVAPDGRIANSDIDIRHSFAKDIKGFMDDHRLRAKAVGTL